MAATHAPWMGTLTLTTANTAYQLSALLDALIGDNRPLFIHSRSTQFVAIQADVDAGAAKLYIGNSNLSSTNCGVIIYATQVWPIYSMESNLIHLEQIYLMYDTTDGLKVNVTFLTR